MIDLDGSDFIQAYQGLASLSQLAGSQLQRGQGLAIVELSVTEQNGFIETMQAHAISINLPLTIKSLKLVKQAFDAGTPNIENGINRLLFNTVKLHELNRRLFEFTQKIRDEYSTRVFLCIPYARAQYYQSPQNIFGDKVWFGFPSQGQYEMDEACKCFALGRYTSAVFHLMRLMELGIEAVRLCMRLPDPIRPADRNWGFILRNLADGKKAKDSANCWAIALDKMFFDEVYLLLTAVKDTWRNPTMHVENKYTDEEAEHIFSSVRTFMRKIAVRIDENGDPKS